MPPKITIEEVQKRIRSARGSVVSIIPETYTKISAKATFIDRDYGKFTSWISSVLYDNCRHPQWYKDNVSKIRSLDLAELKKRIQKVHGDKVIIIESTYKNTISTATFIDRDYGEFETKPRYVITGSRHPQWSFDLKSHSNNSIQSKIDSVHNGSVKIIWDTYTNIKNTARFIDEIYGEFECTADYVLRGTRHPDFHKSIITTSVTEAQKRLDDRYGAGEYTIDPNTYTALHEKCYIKNNTTNKKLLTTPYSIISGHCLIVRRTGQKIESEILRELKNLTKEEVLVNNRQVITPRELDFYIPIYNFAIEYNGLYWHAHSRIQNSNYHLNKSKACEEKGIELIHIFECDWAVKKPQILSYLRSKLGKNEHRIFARKCQIKEVDKKEARGFVDRIHIQGFNNQTKYSLGLYHNEELVAIACFSPHHRGTGLITLNRFCCLDNTTVVGALSRLSKHASSYFKEDIITWADRSISNGNGYKASGWETDSIIKPDYFYTDGQKRISKQSRKKSNVNTPKDMTESEHAAIDGLMKVYDCGKIRFVYKFKG